MPPPLFPLGAEIAVMASKSVAIMQANRPPPILQL
jgi:hypothetical protein